MLSDGHDLELLTDERALRVRMGLKGMPTTAIALITGGADVKIHGRLRASEVGLVSPVKHRPCAVYCLEIETTLVTRAPQSHGGRQDRKSRTTFQVSISPPELRGSDFAVEDDTGIANVRIQGARIVLAQGFWQWKSEYESPRAAFLLERVGKTNRRRSIIVDYRERALADLATFSLS